MIGNTLVKLDRMRDFYIYDTYRNKYKIHNSFRFNGSGIIFHGNGNIEIGKNSYIGRFSYLQAAEQKNIYIGNDVSISHLVYIYTTSSIADQDFKTKNQKYFLTKNADVIIHDYCWIGAKVFINPGITIGENTVVGANSVVTKNLPPHCIASGAPAKVIRFKNYLDEETKNKLKNEYKSVLSDKIKFGKDSD